MTPSPTKLGNFFTSKKYQNQFGQKCPPPQFEQCPNKWVFHGNLPLIPLTFLPFSPPPSPGLRNAGLVGCGPGRLYPSSWSRAWKITNAAFQFLCNIMEFFNNIQHFDPFYLSSRPLGQFFIWTGPRCRLLAHSNLELFELLKFAWAFHNLEIYTVCI